MPNVMLAFCIKRECQTQLFVLIDKSAKFFALLSKAQMSTRSFVIEHQLKPKPYGSLQQFSASDIVLSGNEKSSPFHHESNGESHLWHGHPEIDTFFVPLQSFPKSLVRLTTLNKFEHLLYIFHLVYLFTASNKILIQVLQGCNDHNYTCIENSPFLIIF